MEQLTKERVFVLCTDGSLKARHAFDELVEEFLTKYDKIKVVMITDAQKTYLSDDYTPKTVQAVYRNALISRVHHTKYEIIFEERNAQFESPKEQLTYTASKLGADYVFLGSFGRKGDQNNKYRVGQTAVQMSARSKIPIVVIKEHFPREKNKTRGFNFACCIDGSRLSLETLSIAKDMARNSNDKIYAVTVDDNGEFSYAREKVKDLAEAESKRLGIKADHIFGQKGLDASESLKTFLEEHPDIIFDFVVFGSMGVHAEVTKGHVQGRLATAMLTRCCLNVVMLP